MQTKPQRSDCILSHIINIRTESYCPTLSRDVNSTLKKNVHRFTHAHHEDIKDMFREKENLPQSSKTYVENCTWNAKSARQQVRHPIVERFQ